MMTFLLVAAAFIAGWFISPIYRAKRREREISNYATTLASRSDSVEEVERRASKWEEIYDIRHIREIFEGPLYIKALNLVRTRGELDRIGKTLFYGYTRHASETIAKLHELP